MAPRIKVSGRKTDTDTAKVFKCGRTVPSTKEPGQMIWRMERVASFITTVTFTKVNGSMIRPMVKVLIITKMVPSMLVSGLKINSTEQALRPGLMVHVMRVPTSWVKSTATAPSSRPTNQLSLANLLITTSMVAVSTPGLMEGSTKENGKITACTEKAPLCGAMGADILVSMLRTKRMDTVNLCGPMAAHTKAIGLTENNTELACRKQLMASGSMALGTRVVASSL
jgi:hypothetical protein